VGGKSKGNCKSNGGFFAVWCESLLEEGEEGEEEEPEESHGVPVPGCAIDQDLAGFQLAGDVEAGEGGDEGGDAEEEMDGVDAGDQVEEVAALIAAAEQDVLAGELTPGDPLAGEEEQAEDDGGGEPRDRAAGDGFAEA
jgi:hypothetical protein